MDIITIEVKYIEYTTPIGMTDLEVVNKNLSSEKLERIQKERSGKMQKIIAYFKKPKWSSYNNDKGKFTEYNPKTNLYELDRIRFMDYQLRNLFLYIEKENGEKIDMNESLIDSLNQNVANQLVLELSEYFLLDNEEIKELVSAASKFYKGDRRTQDIKHLPSEIIEVELAEMFNWTLDYIRSIDIQDMEKLMIVLGQRSLIDQQKNPGNPYDVVDEKTGMRLVGGQHVSSEMRDKIAHRITGKNKGK